MKRLLKQLPLALLIALFAGCCSVTISQKGDRDMVCIRNEGWKFLGIPIASGDPEYPNQDVSVWFCDSVLLEVNMMLLDNAMTEHGYRSFKNLTSYKTDEKIIPLLIKRYTYETSAELCR